MSDITITPNDVHSFYSQFLQDNKSIEEKTLGLYENTLAISEWMDKVRDIDSQSRKIYLDNSSEVERILKPFAENPELLTPELVDAFLEEITPLVSTDYPDFEITHQMLVSILSYMEKHNYPKLQIMQVENSIALSKITIKQPIQNIANFPGLPAVLKYIDDNTGSEAMVHIQSIVMMLTIKRRIHTFSHSVIVSKLATLIARKLIGSNPLYFDGIGKNPADILGFVNTASLLHDVGKSDIAHIINIQNRALTDQEFALIRKHPEIGGQLLESIPSLSVFADIARGHHKYYDGSAGYPEEFDNLKSDYKNIIDLITVCDSIDAGTDNLGRSYSEAKPFSKILEELNEEKGTRYSPLIVDTITGDEMLIEQIESIISVGRENVYYEIYRQYMQGEM